MRRELLSGALAALALAIYFAATLPYLGNFPPIGQDEPWIAAPAAKLADQGIYGSDLFAGYYGMERRSYNFPPLFPLAEALLFRLVGVGAWQARLTAVLLGAATLLLTWRLGRRLGGPALGVLAAWLLVGLRVAIEPQASGVPLLDLARIARYDIAVPPLVLLALLCFVGAEGAPGGAGQHMRHLLAGALAGLALLAHVYGGAVLALLGALLLWRHGRRLPRVPAPYLIGLGCGLALLPWWLYLAQDPAAWRGQMRPEQTRLDLLSPQFLLRSLLDEPTRYRRLFFDGARPALWPRLGVWLALPGLALAFALLLRACWQSAAGSWQRDQLGGRAEAERMLLLALPLLALLLALLVDLKFYNYILPLLPFAALNLAWLGLWLWRRQGRAARAGLALLLAAALGEAGLGIRQSLAHAAAASDYQGYTARVAARIPPGARVLALHQFWFGLYARGYVYRSAVLPTYLARPELYPAGALPIEQALAQIAPEYVLVDPNLAQAVLPGQPTEALVDPLWLGYRRYLDRHCSRRPGVQIDDRDYGVLYILSCES